MEISLVQKVSQNLISFAIQRCRISENICRLSVLLKCYSDSDPPTVQIAISDTGVGSSLAEFQDMHYARNCFHTEKWDGMLSITTTSMHDKEIYHFHLNLKETLPTTRLTRLPSTPKNSGKFSGTEISFSTHENIDDFIAWITGYFQKILILKIPKVAVELTVEHINSLESGCKTLLQANEGILLPFAMSNIERITSGFEDYVLKRGNAVDKECQARFSSREQLKVGSGLAFNAENLKSTGQMMEAVVVITDLLELENPTWLRASETRTKVLYFQDFSPCSIPQSSFNALTSIDWQSYGLTLRDNAVDGNDQTILEWENLQPFTHIDIVLHSYHKKIMVHQTPQRTGVDRNLVKKAVKLALDDLKAKYTGFFLSSHALKIRSCVPDLSIPIAGLILSSNDSDFQRECASLLGLSLPEVGQEGKVESSIREKIIRVIEMNDRKPKRARDHAPCLFEDASAHEEVFQDEEDEDEDGISVLDL